MLLCELETSERAIQKLSLIKGKKVSISQATRRRVCFFSASQMQKIKCSRTFSEGSFLEIGYINLNLFMT